MDKPSSFSNSYNNWLTWTSSSSPSELFRSTMKDLALYGATNDESDDDTKSTDLGNGTGNQDTNED